MPRAPQQVAPNNKASPPYDSFTTFLLQSIDKRDLHFRTPPAQVDADPLPRVPPGDGCGGERLPRPGRRQVFFLQLRLSLLLRLQVRVTAALATMPCVPPDPRVPKARCRQPHVPCAYRSYVRYPGLPLLSVLMKNYFICLPLRRLYIIQYYTVFEL